MTDPATTTQDARGKRTKRILLAAIAVASGLAMLAWSQTWFTIAAVEAVELAEPAHATGEIAAPPLMALALAGFASLAGLALAGLVLRWILGVLVVLLGGIAVATSLLAIANPVRSVGRLVTDLTGVAGGASTAVLVDAADIDTTLWPWLGVLSGVLLAAAGVAVVVTARRWPASARRFETRFADADSALPVDSIERWDALSSGDDPTRAWDEAQEDDEDDGREDHANDGNAGAGPVEPRRND